MKFNKAQYKKYLLSKEWKDKRNELFNKIGRECEQCGSINKIQVHHKTYKNFGNEELEDLQVLCYNCHMSKHDKYFDKYVLSKKVKAKKQAKKPLDFKAKIKMLESKKGRKKLRKKGYKF